MGNRARMKTGATAVSTSPRNFPNRMGPDTRVCLRSAELAGSETFFLQISVGDAIGMLRSSIRVEIDLSSHPLLVAFGEPCGNETHTGGGIGEDGGEAGTALDLAVDAFQPVGRAQAGAQSVGQIEYGEALEQIVLDPLSELGCLGLPGVESLAQEPIGLGPVGARWEEPLGERP